MPEMDGLEVCRELRQTSDVPILFLSARDEEIDRVLGLEIGGDDYVTKPFSPRELVARVNVILRRARRGAGRQADGRAARRMARLTLDPASHAARFDGTPLALTAIEFAILKALAGAAGACAQPRADDGRRLRRQHPCRRPHHRQPHPQHPRQARRSRLRSMRSRRCMASASGSADAGVTRVAHDAARPRNGGRARHGRVRHPDHR